MSSYKRTRPESPHAMPILKLHIDDEAINASRVIEKQEHVISSNAPHRLARTKSILAHHSDTVNVPKRKPMVTFPQSVCTSTSALISPPMPGEAKWTSCQSSPVTDASVDEGRSYSNGLAKWSPIAFEGLKKLPQATWIQYTSNVYPEYKERKKVVATTDDPESCWGENIYVWSIVPSDFKARGATTIDAARCMKGFHRAKETPCIPFRECEHCPAISWVLARGAPQLDRKFYVTPWVIQKIQ